MLYALIDQRSGISALWVVTMRQLTAQGQQLINDLAQRYGVSTDAVMTLLQALINGGGAMAQFSHPQLGGSGQWLQGGMTMVGDMFNNSLKATVDGLCAELATLLANQQLAPSSGQWQQQGGGQQQQQGGSGFAGDAVSLFVAGPGAQGSNWWPSELGMPSATGAQNNVRYAYFPNSRRLAVDVNGKVTVYDTLDHQIGGFGQQQGGGASITFTSQYGVVFLNDLPVVKDGGEQETPAPPSQETPVASPSSQQFPGTREAAAPTSAVQETDVFAMLEKLAALKQQGIITDEEFAAKKADLLGRL